VILILTTTYMIDIPTQQKTMFCRDVMFDDDVRFSSSQDSPSMTDKREEVVISKIYLENQDELDSEGDEVR
jgi:hypothetical protein